MLRRSRDRLQQEVSRQVATSHSGRGSVHRSTAHAGLAAVGVHRGHLDRCSPIRQQVHIAQKSVRYTPADQLYDAFIALLAGAHGLVEITGRLRADRALQAAFGRRAGAEPSVVQETLEACTEETVTPIEAARDPLSRQHSQGDGHDDAQDWPIRDVDRSGLPCGKKAALATPGSCAKQRNRRGRQLGRVLATRSHAIVVERLVDGKTQLITALRPLVVAAERTREWDAAQRERTLIRIDAGAGRVADRNWLLCRGSHVLATDDSTQRAALLAAHVTDWCTDPGDPGRQVGLVPVPADDSHAGSYRPTITRVAVRCRLATGQWGVGVVIGTLPAAEALRLTGQGPSKATDRQACTLACTLADVGLDDQRGGGVDTTFKEDKQGLGITKRSTKHFAAQQVVVALGALAHTVLGWAKRWLPPQLPGSARSGVKRLVREVFGSGGPVELDADGRVTRIVLNQANRLSRWLLAALQPLASSAGVAVTLGET